MKLFCLITVILLFVTTVPDFSQQFVLEWEISEELIYVGDIDGDGIGEFVSEHGDTTTFYDGQNHNQKWTITGKNFNSNWWDADPYIHPHYLIFPSIDYNGDGNREVIFEPSVSEGFIIVDVVNNTTVFEWLDSQIDKVHFVALSDVDGDGELELVFTTNQISGGKKSYVYSTGVQITAVKESEEYIPNGFNISQNYPNPFNPSTKIEYSIPEPSSVRINIFNINGEQIKKLINEEKNTGNYSVTWNGKDNKGNIVASGTYFYQIQVGDFVQAKKMILLK